MSSVSLQRAAMYRNQGQQIQEQLPPRQLTNDPLDGKSYILYFVHGQDGQIDANCVEAVALARQIDTVALIDAMKVVRPEWLTKVPCCVDIANRKGTTGEQAAKTLRDVLVAQKSAIGTIGLARPQTEDAPGLPSFASLGHGTAVGEVSGIGMDASRYVDGKINNQTLQAFEERRKQKPSFVSNVQW
jgi:hypothetical protein